MKSNWILIAILLIMILSGPAVAKEGAYFGLGMVENIILSDDVDFVEDAYGPNIFVGYKFRPLGVEVDWVSSEHQGHIRKADADLTGFSLNFIVPILSRDERSESYLLGGYGLYKFDLSNGNELEGNGYNLGVGIDHYFNERVAQVVRIMYRYIDYDKANNPTVPTPLEGNVFTVEIGFKHYF